MRVLRSVIITDVVAVAACVVGYLLLAHPVNFSLVRPNAVTSEPVRQHAPVPNRGEQAAAIRSPAERIQDAFEQFPGSQRPATKSGNKRSDGIMFC